MPGVVLIICDSVDLSSESEGKEEVRKSGYVFLSTSPFVRWCLPYSSTATKATMMVLLYLRRHLPTGEYQSSPSNATTTYFAGIVVVNDPHHATRECLTVPHILFDVTHIALVQTILLVRNRPG